MNFRLFIKVLFSLRLSIEDILKNYTPNEIDGLMFNIKLTIDNYNNSIKFLKDRLDLKNIDRYKDIILELLNTPNRKKNSICTLNIKLDYLNSLTHNNKLNDLIYFKYFLYYESKYFKDIFKAIYISIVK